MVWQILMHLYHFIEVMKNWIFEGGMWWANTLHSQGKILRYPATKIIAKVIANHWVLPWFDGQLSWMIFILIIDFNVLIEWL